MNFQDLNVIRALQESFRRGLVESWREYDAMRAMGVLNFERTLYPLWYRHSLAALEETETYAELARTPGFLLIGDVGLPGFTERADAMICVRSESVRSSRLRSNSAVTATLKRTGARCKLFGHGHP